MTFIVVTLAVADTANAGGRRRAVARPIDPGALSIVFVSNVMESREAGFLDLGTFAGSGVSNARRRGAAFMTHEVRIRVERASGISGGMAVVRVRLRDREPRCTTRIGGIELTEVFRVVDPQMRIGGTSVYRLEIEVPVMAAEGPLFSAIEWEVTEI